MAAELRDYVVPVKRTIDPATASTVPLAAAAAADEKHDSFRHLSSCWLRLLRSGQHADLDLVCKEETTVACHRLVLAVRCPLLLSQVIEERSATATTRDYVIMSNYDSCVVGVLMEYLYGGLFTLAKLTESQQLRQLQQLASCYQVHALKECLNSVEISVVEDSQEDNKKVNDSRGFFGDGEVEEEKTLEPTGTQNLDALAGLLDETADEDDNVVEREEYDDQDLDNDKADDWDEFCVALTQKARRKNDSADSSDEEKEGGCENELFWEFSSRTNEAQSKCLRSDTKQREEDELGYTNDLDLLVEPDLSGNGSDQEIHVEAEANGNENNATGSPGSNELSRQSSQM